MLQTEKDRWNSMLWNHWQGIAPDAIPGMDDEDDPEEIMYVTISTIWDNLSFEDQEALIREGKTIRKNFIEYVKGEV